MSVELQRKEQWLREERTEREKLEVELGRERDCNKVSKSKYIAVTIISHTNTFRSKNNHSCATNLHHQSLGLQFRNWRTMPEFNSALLVGQISFRHK